MRFTAAVPRLVPSPCRALSYMDSGARRVIDASGLRVQLRKPTVDDGIRAERERFLVVGDRRVDPSGAGQRGGETEMIGRATGFPIDRLLPERRGAIVAALGGAQRGLFLQDIERDVATPVGQHLTLRLLDALELPRGLFPVPQPHQRGRQRISRLGVGSLTARPRAAAPSPPGCTGQHSDESGRRRHGHPHPGDRSAVRRRAPRMPRRRGPAAEAHRPGTCARPDRWGLHGPNARTPRRRRRSRPRPRPIDQSMHGTDFVPRPRPHAASSNSRRASANRLRRS